MADLACLRCGATNFLPDGAVHGYHNLKVDIPTNPAALLLKGIKSKLLYARVCGRCGHAELFIKGASELWDKYQQNND